MKILSDEILKCQGLTVNSVIKMQFTWNVELYMQNLEENFIFITSMYFASTVWLGLQF